MFKTSLLTLCLSLLMFISAAPAVVQAETTSVVLSIEKGEREYRLTLEDIKAFTPVTFETETIWTHGVQSFEGVRLKDLLDSINISNGQLRAIAVNDYAVNIPVADAVSDGPIIAYKQNGAEMSRRRKGPLWIVYPYDDKKSYQTETVYSRSIWQLDRLITQ